MFIKIFLVLTSAVQIGLSIRCFECSSVNNSMCLEPTLYDPETLANFLHLVECRRGVVAADEGYQFFCRKIQQTIMHKHYAPEVRVMRGCGWKRDSRPCYKADNEDHLETVCQCFSDACNTAYTTAIPLILIVISQIVPLKLF